MLADTPDGNIRQMWRCTVLFMALPLLGGMIRIVGPAWAALMATASGVAAMLAATYWFVRRLGGANAALVAAVKLVLEFSGRDTVAAAPTTQSGID